LAVFFIWDYPVSKNPDVLAKYPKMAAHRTRIAALPKIAEYTKTRCSDIFPPMEVVKKVQERAAAAAAAKAAGK
jgi:hypothetical protein